MAFVPDDTATVDVPAAGRFVPDEPAQPAAPRTGASAIPTEAEAAGKPYVPPAAPLAPKPVYGITDRIKGAVEAGVNTATGVIGALVGGVTGAGQAVAESTGLMAPSQNLNERTNLATGAKTSVGPEKMAPISLEEAMGRHAEGITGALKRTFTGPADLRAEQTPDSELGQQYTEALAPAMETMLAAAPLHGTMGPKGGTAPALQAAGDIRRGTVAPVARAGAEAAGAQIGKAARKVLPVDPELAKVAQIASEQKYPIDVRPDQVIEGAKFSKLAGQAASDTPLAGSARESNQVAFTRNLIDMLDPTEAKADRLTPEVFDKAMRRSGEGIGDIMAKTDVPVDSVREGADALRANAEKFATDNDKRIVGNYIDELTSKADENGVINGTALKELNSEIGARARTEAGNDLGRRLNDLQDIIQDAVEKHVEPGDATPLREFRRQYAYGKMVEPLVAKTIDGKVSPAGLMARVTATKQGKQFMARSAGGPIGDLAKVGQLIKEPGSSGTAERSLVYGAIKDTAKTAAGIAGGYPLAAAYNVLGPKLTRAMVGKRAKKAAPKAPEPPPEPTTSPGAGPGTPPPAGKPPGPLGDLTPDWETTPGAGGGRPRGGSEPGLVPAVGEKPITRFVPDRKAETPSKRAGSEIPAVPGRPGVPDTMLTGRPRESAATERANAALQEPGAQEAIRQLRLRDEEAARKEIPVGETREVPLGEGVKEPKAPGKIPVGKATEITPERVTLGEEPIPVGEATHLTPELIEADKKWRTDHKLGEEDAGRARDVARALGYDEKAVEAAARQHDNSPRAFDREIARINAEAEAVSKDTMPSPKQGDAMQKASGKPRLGESADEVWKGMQNEVVEPGRGILYPTARIVGGGGDFQVSPSGKLQKRTGDGRGIRDVTRAEEADFHDALEKDQVQVLVRSQWGGSGNDRATASRDLRELHSPSGNSFRSRTRENESKQAARSSESDAGTSGAPVRQAEGQPEPAPAVRAATEQPGADRAPEAGTRRGGAEPAGGQGSVEALRKKWPGLAHASDEHVLAAETWQKADQRLRGYPDHPEGTIHDALVSEWGQKRIANDQVGYLTELTKRLDAEFARRKADENTEGTLANRRAAKTAESEAEHRVTAMHKAALQEIDLAVKEIRDMHAQGRITDADFAELTRISETSRDAHETATRLHDLLESKMVAREREGMGGGSAANESGRVARDAAKANGVEIVEVPGGFEARRDGKRVGYLRDNLERGQAELLGENANVDMVKVDKGEAGQGTGRALYEAFNEKHGGRILPSGKTEPSAWKLWKRNYPEKVDQFVKDEAQRIRGGADPGLVARNITDAEVRSRVLKESERGPDTQPDNQPGAVRKEAGQEGLQDDGGPLDKTVEAGQELDENRVGAPEAGGGSLDKAATPRKRIGSAGAMDKMLRERFGDKLIQGLKDQGILKYEAEHPERPWSAATFNPGFDPGSKPHATLYFGKLTPEEVPKALMHELGEHFGMVRLLGQERYNVMLNELRGLKDTDEVKDSWAHVKKFYTDRDARIKEGGTVFLREVAAHLVESHPDLPFVRRIVNEIRAFFYENFGTTMGTRVDADLIRGLAASALRKASKGELPRMQASMRVTPLVAPRPATNLSAPRRFVQ